MLTFSLKISLLLHILCTLLLPTKLNQEFSAWIVSSIRTTIAYIIPTLLCVWVCYSWREVFPMLHHLDLYACLTWTPLHAPQTSLNQVADCQTTIWRQTCAHSVSLTSPNFLTSPHPTRYVTGSVRQQKESVGGFMQTTLQHPLSLKHKCPFWSETTRFHLYIFPPTVLFPNVADQTWSQEGGNPVYLVILTRLLTLRE